MQIWQDPADTTPARSGKLCFVCNKENRTDKTARHACDLWSAAFSSGEDYMRTHYWTNAVMHGISGSAHDEQIDSAQKCCKLILHEQIKVLSPRVIIACGGRPIESLKQIGALEKSANARQAPYNSQIQRDQQIFCTYHTSGRAVNNRWVQRLYDPSVEEALSGEIERLEDQTAVRAFLDAYPPNKTEGRGMRVLLLHWFEIGRTIRKANATNS
jgi:uracil DNA glycosylase superfamily protein